MYESNDSHPLIKGYQQVEMPSSGIGQYESLDAGVRG